MVRSSNSDLKPIVPQEQLQTIDICRGYSYEGVVGWTQRISTPEEDTRNNWWYETTVQESLPLSFVLPVRSVGPNYPKPVFKC